MTGKSDIELLDAAISGHVESFGELCRRYYPAMVAVAHSILGERHLAEDAVQEAFAKVCYKPLRLRDKRKFAGWLAVVCRNVAKDMAKVRDKINCVEIENLSTISSKLQQNQRDDLSKVRDAVSRLPMLDREVIFLRYYNNMPYEQISEILGISKPAINGKLTRAKKKIAEYLQKNCFMEIEP